MDSIYTYQLNPVDTIPTSEELQRLKILPGDEIVLPAPEKSWWEKYGFGSQSEKYEKLIEQYRGKPTTVFWRQASATQKTAILAAAGVVLAGAVILFAKG